MTTRRRSTRASATRMRTMGCAAALTIAVVVAAVGCGGGTGVSAVGASHCPPAPTGSGVIDEKLGSFRGARIGDGLHAALRHFAGVERRWDAVSVLTLSGCGQPKLSPIVAGSHIRAARLPDSVLTFAGVPARVTAFITDGRGARTRAGVRIGDALSHVKARYPAGDVRCGHELSDDGPLWPSCDVTSGRFDVYFGGDPINEIAVRRGSDFG
jgi:hypothetical protein